MSTEESEQKFARNSMGDPPGATIAVVSLMPPEAPIEIEAIAAVD